MKPTRNCKLNYLRKNYIHDIKIPTISVVKKKFNLNIDARWPDYKKAIIEFSLFSNGEEIIDYMLADTSVKSCVNCLHKYKYQLTGKCNETYIKL